MSYLPAVGCEELKKSESASVGSITQFLTKGTNETANQKCNR